MNNEFYGTPRFVCSCQKAHTAISRFTKLLADANIIHWFVGSFENPLYWIELIIISTIYFIEGYKYDKESHSQFLPPDSSMKFCWKCKNWEFWVKINVIIGLNEAENKQF